MAKEQKSTATTPRKPKGPDLSFPFGALAPGAKKGKRRGRPGGGS
jgi:hypothetical protein